MSDLIRDMDIADLREYLGKWREDRIKQTVGGRLDDHQFLVGVIKDAVQDITVLISVTLGLLDRLAEEAKDVPTQDMEASDE